MDPLKEALQIIDLTCKKKQGAFYHLSAYMQEILLKRKQKTNEVCNETKANQQTLV